MTFYVFSFAFSSIFFHVYILFFFEERKLSCLTDICVMSMQTLGSWSSNTQEYLLCFLKEAGIAWFHYVLSKFEVVEKE